MKTVFYIDGFNFFYSAVKGTPLRRLDFQALLVRVFPSNTIEVYKTEEKGSDVNIAAHLLMDGFLDAYECAIVVSGDSDLVTPIRMVRDQLKKPVGVLNPQRLSGPDKRPERKTPRDASPWAPRCGVLQEPQIIITSFYLLARQGWETKIHST